MRLRAKRNTCGHVSGDPSGEADQSKAWIRSPMLPPPAKKCVVLKSPKLLCLQMITTVHSWLS